MGNHMSYHPSLHISRQQIDDLRKKAAGLERSDKTGYEVYANYKICPTRHGCTGATNCDYSYGAPVKR